MTCCRRFFSVLFSDGDSDSADDADDPDEPVPPGLQTGLFARLLIERESILAAPLSNMQRAEAEVARWTERGERRRLHHSRFMAFIMDNSVATRTDVSCIR